MRIEHIGIWTRDLEMMRTFYTTFFKLKSNDLYVNSEKGFSSYFLSFSSGARLELMHSIHRESKENSIDELTGLAHIAISLGSKSSVLNLTEELREKGFKIVGEPRTTGDGYFESVIEDPEGNNIELTI